MDDNLVLLPSQVKYITRREALLVSSLTEDVSSTDRLLNCLEETPGVTDMVLTDDVGVKSGLCITINKGRPMKLSSQLTKEFDADHIRKNLSLREDQSLLLAICWISDEENRIATMSLFINMRS